MVKIIIIDDETWIRKLIIKLLPYNMFQIKIVGEAEDGEDGLELAIRERPDIILTDIRMPLLSGIDLIKELNTRLPKSKIIIISGYDNFNYAQTALKYGVVDFLLKPVEKEELNTAIKKAIKDIKKDAKVFNARNLEKQIKRLSLDFIETDNNDFSNITNNKIRKSLKYINENYQRPISLNDVSDAVLMNSSYLSELFKKEVGTGFNQYLMGIRFDVAKKLLIKNKDLTIGDISELVGFIDPNYFSRLFKKNFDYTPQDFRNKQL